MYALIRDHHGMPQWQGLPLICAWLGITDIEALMHRLALIKLHRREQEES